MARTAATKHFGIPPTDDISEFEAGYSVGFVEAYQLFASVFTQEMDRESRLISRAKLALNTSDADYHAIRLGAIVDMGAAQRRALPQESRTQDEKPKTD